MDEILRELKDLIDGKPKGWSYGFESLDDSLGRIQAGQLITIGGFTGAGKSFFALNMVKNLKSKGVKIAIFSSELSTKEYLTRYACMLEGIWRIQLTKEPKKYFRGIENQFAKLSKERIDGEVIDIYGDIIKLEQVEQVLKETHYDLVFVDFIQNISYKNKFDEKDKMPIIADALKKITIKHDCAMVVMSQMNISAMSSKPDNIYNHGFSYGKELSHMSHTAIKLMRRKDSEGKDMPFVEVHIVKARDGQQGISVLKINSGYRLEALSDREIIEYQSLLKQK